MTEITMRATGLTHRNGVVILRALLTVAKAHGEPLQVRTDESASRTGTVDAVRVHPRYGDTQFRCQGEWYNITAAPWEFFLR